jgi:hypothetical protein
MRTLSIIAAATTALLANPAAAQTAAPRERVIASYDFSNNSRELSFPRSLTVADSAGKLLARVFMPGGAAAVDMAVTVIESNLVLQGQTRDGLLTLVLDRQNEGGEIRLASGSWTLGKTSGELRARKP